MKLSIAMIVKNEDKNLERTLIPLKNLKEYIDVEIVIVDTGSTDNTIKIAKKYTDKVYLHIWNNDFAAMRNISIDYCTGDWILILDADEVLYDIRDLGELFNRNITHKYNSAFIKIVNFNKDIENSINNGNIAPLLRIFKKNTVKYEGIVHEQPDFKSPVLNTNIRFIHYGYDNNDYELMECKFKRNIELLFKQLRDNPEDIYVNFQIATSYAMHKDLEEALKYITKAYELCKCELTKYIYVIDKYCYILYNLRKYELLKEKAIEGINNYKNFLDFYFYLGEACFNLKQYDQSIDAYCNYLDMYKKLQQNEIEFNSILSESTRGFKDNILYNLAMNYYNLKKYNYAIDTIEKINNKNIIKDKIYGIFKIIDKGDLWNKLYIIDGMIDKYNFEDALLYVHEELSLSKLQNIEVEELKELKLIINIASYFKTNNNINEEIFSKIKEIILKNKIPYIVFVYYALKYNINEIKSFICFGKDKIESILVHLCKNYYDFNEALYKGLKVLKLSTFSDILIRTTVLKSLILGGNLPKELKAEIFLSYVARKYYTIIRCYDNEIIKHNLWIIPSEERFIIELKETLSYKYNDTLQYIKSMKNILNLDNAYIDYIKLLIDEYEKVVISNEVKAFIPKLVKSIQALINNEKYQDAYNTIEKGLSLVNFDFDLMVLKYKLLVNFNYIEEATECLDNIILYGDTDRVNNFIYSI
ncbi:glycosyltransferase family 2 protein [Clostridium botulinum]|nr:glycosyltransferase family 2 protein [Clostridium botulinum]NFD34328.1 glycosyltransferase family 2 protein [Clostridium botulinum]NFD58652.1 glycosyltransferase family 2 protein [Clostridium botulinum]NFE00442.1 glycosyltransferase family 2 protein [Clostridium botulinum]